MRLLLITLIMLGTTAANAALIEGNLATAGDGLITIDTDTGLEWLDFDQNRMGWNETVADAMTRVTTGTYVTEHGFRIATAAEVATLFQHARFLDTPNEGYGYEVLGTWSNTVMLGAGYHCWATNPGWTDGCEWQVKGLHAGAIAGEWQFSQFDCYATYDLYNPMNSLANSCPAGGPANTLYSLGNTVSPDQLGESLIDFRALYSNMETPGVFMVRATVVPIPAAIWLFGSALLGLRFVRWRISSP